MPLTLAHETVRTPAPAREPRPGFITFIAAGFLDQGYGPADVAYFAAAFDHAAEMERLITEAMAELEASRP